MLGTLHDPKGKQVVGEERQPVRESSTRSSRESSTLRPPTTDATARRLIAGALGIKSLRQRTPEQRAYDDLQRQKVVAARQSEREDAQRREQDVADAWEGKPREA